MPKKFRHVRGNVKPINHDKVVAQQKILKIKNKGKDVSFDVALDTLLDTATLVL